MPRGWLAGVVDNIVRKALESVWMILEGNQGIELEFLLSCNFSLSLRTTNRTALSENDVFSRCSRHVYNFTGSDFDRSAVGTVLLG